MTALATRPVQGRTPVRTLQGFADLAASVAAAANDPPWLHDLRQAATKHFVDVGLPGSKDEEWRFTSLQSLAAHRFSPLSLPSSDCVSISGPEEWPLLVVVDGKVDARMSKVGTLQPGVTFGAIATEIGAGNPLVEKHLAKIVPTDATPFSAASAALFLDGAFVHVGPGVSAPNPMHIVYVATDAATDSVLSPRSLVVIDRGGSGVVMESFVVVGSPDGYLTNVVCEVVLGEGARLEHIRSQRESLSAWHVGFTGVEQQRDSHYRSFTFALGARMSRHNLHARLGAPNIETLLYGLYLARGEQLVDNHTAIFHDHPDCNSWEVYKGVLAEKAHGVFNGKVFVKPEAQKTDAKQTNRNLLLSDTARVDTKPQLEIFADDVKCTHGATVGKLNEQQRFYLRTRGIAGREAEVMLITAFVSEVLAEITQSQVREALEALVHAEMDALIG